MKKLFIYALLAMTGFAFYSCDERFDNPVTEQQDPSNPNATWSYEVAVKFANFCNNGYKDVDGQKYTYTAPSTIYVFNKAYERLGELKVVEPEEFPDSFTTADFDKSYKFAGKLQGAIGEELIIASLDNMDYISKQDGTQKTIMKSCILQTAEVPIIVTNATKGTIGTQSVTLKNKTHVRRCKISTSTYNNYVSADDRTFTVMSDSLFVPRGAEKEIVCTLPEEYDMATDYFYIAVVTEAKGSGVYQIAVENEAYGYGSACKIIWSNSNDYIYASTLSFGYLKYMDLTKYYAYKKSLDENLVRLTVNVQALPDTTPIITQSGKDALPISLYLQRVKNITIKNINIRMLGTIGIYSTYPGNENDYRPVITLEGENIVGSEDNLDTYALQIDVETTIKGTGSLTLDAGSWGIDIKRSYQFRNEEGDYKYLPAGLIIEDDVKIVSKTQIELIGWMDGDDKAQCFINLNGGSLDVTGYNNKYAVYMNGTNGVTGKMTIGTGATYFKAKTGKTDDTPVIVCDFPTRSEVTLDRLVEDATKFTDEIKDGVRTITPKK